MQECRCIKCGLLLGKVNGTAEIKCRKCGTTNQIDTKKSA